jgi:hypothetical protein
MNTVTLGDLAAITGRPRDTIRNMQNRDGTPWDDDALKTGGIRRYAVDQALALIVCEMLEQQGFKVSDAAQFVRTQTRALVLFLDNLPLGDEADARFVIALRVAVEDSQIGVSWQNQFLVGYGTHDEIADHIAGALDRVGSEVRGGTSRRRTIGGPHIGVAPVAEAYRLLRARAESAGFRIDGRDITEV